jgi:methyltransferase family protein
MMATRPDYDVITCTDMLEDVINPAEVVRNLVEHLRPGGTLHLDFNHARGGENPVESAAKRAGTIRYLDTALRGVVPLRVDVADEVRARYVWSR